MTFSFDDYRTCDATALAKLVQRKDVTPQELLDCAIGRAEQVNDQLHAITLWFQDIAERQIVELDARAAFAGVPFLLKDLYCFMAGTPLSNGTRLAPPTASDLESTLVKRFRQAGLITFGKTASPEFGLNVVTEPKAGAACRNPWNPERSPGGSSGGAAAAVAAGIVPMAHGSDGGGSIRIPASSCGLFGFKPSRGLMPEGPYIGEGWCGFATSNVISRSVRDTALIMDQTAGVEPGSPYAPPHMPSRFANCLEQPPGRQRIALMTRPIVDIEIDPACIDATQHAAKLLEELGHEIEEARPKIEADQFAHAFLTIVTSNLAQDLEGWKTRLGDAYDESQLETCTRLLAERGRSVPAMALLSAIQFMHRTGREIGRFFERFDAVLSPTMAALPARIGQLDQDDGDVGRFLERNLPYTAFTALYNAVGCPAMNLPLHWQGDLPVGTMLAGPLGKDGLLIALAAEIERSQPWGNRRPKI